MRLSLLLVLASSFLLVNCSKEDSPTGKSGATASAADVAAAKTAAGTANGRCPVQTDELVDKDAPTRMFKDPKTGKEQKIGFCCDRCPKTFDKNPEQYMNVMRADPVKFGYTLP